MCAAALCVSMCAATDDLVPMSLKVAVIGGGSWGTTIAHLCAHNVPTRLYARDHAVVDMINCEGMNRRYLQDYMLHQDLRATSELDEALDGVSVVVIAVPSHGFRAVLRRMKTHMAKSHAGGTVPIVSATKGLESGTAQRMTEIISDELPGSPVGVLTGPNLSKEVMSSCLTAAVLAMEEETLANQIRDVFSASCFRVYVSADVVGAEMAGATKNVIAIAAGIVDVLQAGENTKAALVTRGLAEMTRLGVAAGGSPITFIGLAGVGDLMATCMSRQSRNRYVGERLGQGAPIEEIVMSMEQVAEGVKSAPTIVSLAQTLGVAMPIAEQVQAVIEHGRRVEEAYQALIDRPPAREDVYTT